MTTQFFDFQNLEQQVDELLQHCVRLADENESLRIQQQNLLLERTALLEKNALARTRIKSMIERLKAMEIAGS